MVRLLLGRRMPILHQNVADIGSRNSRNATAFLDALYSTVKLSVIVLIAHSASASIHSGLGPHYVVPIPISESIRALDPVAMIEGSQVVVSIGQPHRITPIHWIIAAIAIEIGGVPFEPERITLHEAA